MPVLVRYKIPLQHKSKTFYNLEIFASIKGKLFE